jgi:hypothetical protein
MFYALAEFSNKISEKLNLFIALGPVINLTHSHDKFIG